MFDKLSQLRDRLLTAQRALILNAAESGSLPPDSAIRKISDLELAVGAVENMIDEIRNKDKK